MGDAHEHRGTVRTPPRSQGVHHTTAKKERKQTAQGRDGRTTSHNGKKERKKTDNPREGWEDGTPPPHRDFKERRVWCSSQLR